MDNNVIVMTDITGLRYNDIKDLDQSVKYKFAKLLNKFGVLSILFHSCINGDFHAGNVFFYIDNKRDASDNITYSDIIIYLVSIKNIIKNSYNHILIQ